MKKFAVFVIALSVSLVSLGLSSPKSEALQLKDLGGLIGKVSSPIKRRCPLDTQNTKTLPLWCGCRWLMYGESTQSQALRFPCGCPMLSTDSSKVWCGCRRYIMTPDVAQPAVMCPLISTDQTTKPELAPTQQPLSQPREQAEPTQQPQPLPKKITPPIYPKQTEPKSLPAPKPEPMIYPRQDIMPSVELY